MGEMVWRWPASSKDLPDVSWEPVEVSWTDRPRDGVFVADDGQLWIYRDGLIEGTPRPRTRGIPLSDDPELFLLYPLAFVCDMALGPFVLLYALGAGD